MQQRPQTASAQAAQPEKDDAASAQGNTLPTVTVTAESDGIADSAAGRYSTRSTPSGRLSQSAAQTPRAISIVPREVMRDQQVLQEAEAMRNVSSISLFNNYGGSYTGFNLRGIWASNLTSYLRNGTRWTHLIEPMGFNLERIEVIKGPNAIDYGLSTPGGFINYVTKQPLREPLRSASLTAGSHRLGKLEADLSGPIDAQRTLRYRLTGGYERGGAFTDHETRSAKAWPLRSHGMPRPIPSWISRLSTTAYRFSATRACRCPIRKTSARPTASALAASMASTQPPLMRNRPSPPHNCATP